LERDKKALIDLIDDLSLGSIVLVNVMDGVLVDQKFLKLKMSSFNQN
jgi:hypothetical protein